MALALAGAIFLLKKFSIFCMNRIFALPLRDFLAIELLNSSLLVLVK